MVKFPRWRNNEAKVSSVCPLSDQNTIYLEEDADVIQLNDTGKKNS